jgi:hypothetical protein
VRMLWAFRELRPNCCLVKIYTVVSDGLRTAKSDHCMTGFGQELPVAIKQFTPRQPIRSRASRCREA